jgi:hypothetical protein
MILRFVHLQCKVPYRENFCTEKLNSIAVREIRHQRINNYLHTVLVGEKIAGSGRRYSFVSGLPTSGIFILNSKFMDSFVKMFRAFLNAVAMPGGIV